MPDPVTLVLLLFAVLASFFAAWSIGAGSTGATPFAPAVGANAITTLRATLIVGVLGFAGAVLQGAAITETVGRGLIGGVTLTPLAATIALTIAAAYIIAGVFKGYPIATAFAITGSVVGVGLAMGGDPVWRRYAEIGLYWLLTPVFVAPAAYATTRILRSDTIPERVTMTVLVFIVGACIANIEFLVLGPPGEQASIARALTTSLLGQALITIIVGGVLGLITYQATANDPVRAVRRVLLFLGALVAFTAGGGKVGLAVGPLLPIVEEATGLVAVTPVLLFGGLGILVGSWMLASRMIKALAQDYADLGPRRAIGILIPSFVIAQIGIVFGIPMSFNEIFISAIVGTGYAAAQASVSHQKLVGTVAAWIGSIVFSLVIGYAAYTLISLLTGIT